MQPWLERFANTAFRRSADTAHDLKTPLNVAVLNLELLRMRLRKLGTGEEDAKAGDYARSVELELRRMAHIFDAFFLLSTPPKNEGEPQSLDVAKICTTVAETAGVAVGAPTPFFALAHESRIRQAFQLFFEGVSKLLRPEGREAAANSGGEFRLTMTGTPAPQDFEVTKIFKFYYTDPLGNPDLSLASARLIVETCGGELIGLEDHDKVTLRLSLPPGEQ